MKKTIFFSFLLLFIALAVGARELKVESFEAVPTDITARTNAVNDRNGNKCALIKVSLPVSGCDFKGNVLKQEFQVNEYYVYMSGGTKDLQVRCPGVESLMVDFRPFTDGKGLESGMTYYLRLSGWEDAGTGTVKPQVKENFLILDITPKTGAVVKIDGNLQNVDNGKVTVLLGLGTHEVSVEASGYAPYSGSVTITPEGKTQKTVALESQLASLSVKSSTPGARIRINDAEKGTGSFTGNLAAGNYLIEAEKDGYHKYSETITLAPSETRHLTLPALEPIYSTLYVDYKPVGATVNIDGRKVGTTPDIFREVIVGSHEVTISSDGYDTYIATVTLQEGADSKLEGSLKQKSTTDVKKPNPSLYNNEVISTSYSNVNGKITTKHEINGHEVVDLGLSVKWAACNVGAEKPSDYGNYYAWGETTTKSIYVLSTSVTHGKRMNDIRGTQYDVAHTDWGGSWRMPRDTECQELIKKCKWKWTTLDGHAGYKVTGPNGNSIFLPAAGYRYVDSAYLVGSSGFYWSSSPYYGESNAWELTFNDRSRVVDFLARSYGRSVRPVIE